MKELCLVAVADGGYQEYIPLFVYFALFAYPDDEVLVYFDGTLRPQVQDALHVIRGLGSFEVRPVPYAYDRNDRLDMQSFKSLRWLLDDADFAAFRYVCIGDVDMLLARQEPGLCERRARHCDTIALPYSNRIRPGTKKLTGCSHVVRSADYFPPLQPLMARYRAELASGTLRMHNEEFLHRLMAESFGLPDPSASLATHHGVHLRTFHTMRTLDEERARTDYLFTKVFERHIDAFLDAARSDGCTEIVRRLARIEYPAHLARYAAAGPAALQQLRNVRALCDAVLAERALAQ